MRTSMRVLPATAAVAVLLVGTVAAQKYHSHDDVWLCDPAEMEAL